MKAKRFVKKAFPPDEVVTGRLRVCGAGYRVTKNDSYALSFDAANPDKGIAGPVSVLVERGKPGQPGRVRVYDPVTEVEGEPLFLQFAGLAPVDEAGIVAFASRYGFLGTYPVVVAPDEPKPRGVKLSARFGELIRDWSDAIRSVEEAVELWAAKDDGKKLEGLLKSDTMRPGRDVDGEPLVSPTDGKRMFRYRGHAVWAQEGEFGRNDQSAAARMLIRRLVNAGMKGRVVPAVVGYDEEDALRIVPVSVLGAVWLSFAKAFGGNVAVRTCGGCGKWIECRRPDREHCDRLCKVRALRDRQRAKRAQKHKRTES